MNYFYNSHDFCFLPSVSEGCSYGILESINHELPIITTNIKGNQEIIKNLQPTVNFINNNNLIDNSFCLAAPYRDLLLNLGYIDKTFFEKCSCIYKFIDYETFYIPNRILSIFSNIDLCFFCKSNKEAYVDKLKEKSIIFHKNVEILEQGFIDMINNYSKYKSNVIELKKNNIYFSDNNFRKQLLNIFTFYEGI